MDEMEKLKIEIENLKEEAALVFEKCTRCGLCKSLCPVFKVILEEAVSPRGHAINLSDKVVDKIIYKCTLCRACEDKCPLNLKICDAVVKAREALTLESKRKKLPTNPPRKN